MIHYPKPIHLQACFRMRGWKPGSFPVSERLAQQLVSLPLDATHTQDEIARVIAAVRAFFPAAVPAPREYAL
jgi:dTDP-4-amino-4,6-dideoxygalactose transaminase